MRFAASVFRDHLDLLGLFVLSDWPGADLLVRGTISPSRRANVTAVARLAQSLLLHSKSVQLLNVSGCQCAIVQRDIIEFAAHVPIRREVRSTEVSFSIQVLQTQKIWVVDVPLFGKLSIQIPGHSISGRAATFECSDNVVFLIHINYMGAFHGLPVVPCVGGIFVHLRVGVATFR